MSGFVAADVLPGDQGALASFPTSFVAIGPNSSRCPRETFFNDAVSSRGAEQGYISRIFPFDYLNYSSNGVKKTKVLLLESLVRNPTTDSSNVGARERFLPSVPKKPLCPRLTRCR